MPIVRYEGQVYNFPEGTSDEEMFSFLGGSGTAT